MKKLAGFAAIFALTAAVWGDVLDTLVFTRQARYVVDRAYGLSAAAAKDVKVSVTINGATPHEEELYQKAFRATVIDGELVLINAGPAGFTLFFR